MVLVGASPPASWSAIAQRRRRPHRGLLVLSHWVLDAITHRPTCRSGQCSPLVGLGLWNAVALARSSKAGSSSGIVMRQATRPIDRTRRLAFWSLIG
jgi:hypothetical protein